MVRYIRLNLKRVFVLLLTVCLMLPLSVGVSGRTEADIDADLRAASVEADKKKRENDALQERIREIQGDVSQQNYLKTLVEQSMRTVQERIDALGGVIDLQWEAIRAKEAEIAVLERSIENTENEIRLKEVRIINREAENNQNKNKFAQMVKTNYMAGNYGYMEMLMESGDFFDLIARAEVLRKAGDRYNEFMMDLLDAIKALEDEILELEAANRKLDRDRLVCEEEKTTLEVELAQLYSAMDELDKEMDDERTKLYSYSSGISELQVQINSMYRQFNATKEELEELDRLTEALIKEKQNLNRPNYSGDGFIWPLDGRFRMITCDYGYDAWRGGMHGGIDVGNSGINGTNIYAVQSGTVIFAGWSGGYGNCIIIDHGGGISTLYAHMQTGSLRFSAGDDVVQGNVIGLVGNTGWSTGPHLHFEVRENGKAVSPWNYSYG